MIRRPPRSTQSRSSAASDVYKRQVDNFIIITIVIIIIVNIIVNYYYDIVNHY